ncbi:MAG TPA: methyltransferase domain-containing protein [Thermodesulfobacteriota bacterium]
MLATHMDAVRAALTEISLKHGGRREFLDAGCGDGTRTLLFDDGTRNINGCDFKDWLAPSARGRVRLLTADIMKDGLPYEDGSFDLLLSFDVIEHLARPEALLYEMRRVLRPDGVMVVSTPNRRRPYGVVLSMLGKRSFPYGEKKDSDPYAQHIREYTAGELRDALAGAGFSVIRANRVFYGITGWYGVKSCMSLPLFHNMIFECRKG